jgi:adenylate cyclase
MDPRAYRDRGFRRALDRVSGKRLDLTVLFSSIRSFTTYSVRHTPEQMIAVLGEYLTAMVDDIHKFGGMLDKFAGDRVTAVFGAPFPNADHAEKACRTALQVIRTLDKHNEIRAREDLDPIVIQIEINTGETMFLKLETKHLLDYTVIGDAVNLGARLEGVNKVYETAKNIIISEFTRKALGDNFVCRELDLIRVMGREQPVAIFELVGEKEVYVYPHGFIERYEDALEAYKSRKFEKAADLFKQCLLEHDDETCRMYVRRCRHLLKNPPGRGWDGVFTLTTK